MQDELEILKKDWQKQSKTLPILTAEEIYPMLLKRSSSIVKWIFIISLIEFAFWVLLSFWPISQDGDDIIINGDLEMFFNYVVPITHLSILCFFVGWFYKNYRKIQSTDTARQLLKNILKTRKTVTYYIWFSISFLLAATTIAFVFTVQNDLEQQDKNLVALTLQFIAIIGLFVGFLWVVYRLVYGILMRKLTRNYKELKKLEV